MPKKKTVNFALLGLGKLGSGFYNIWSQKREKIKERTGLDLNLKKILVKNLHFKRSKNIDKSLITTDLNDIINDPSIKIAVDAIGGIEPTYSIIKKLIGNKINLVSANRMLLASKMHELMDLANKNKVAIMPEPSLGGGIPIINTLQRDLVANQIHSVIGILSGTSNYILSEMTRKSLSLKEVLKSPEIQNMGESLSMIDYEGSDAAQKVAILAASSFGIDINFLHVYAEGLSNISKIDIYYADKFEYEFKLLAIIKEHAEQFEIRVHPALIPKYHPLSLVIGEYNAYYIQTDLLGSYMLYGKGVGIESVGSLILRDIVAIASNIYHTPVKFDYTLARNKKPVMPIEDIQSSYYLRFPCLDKPGVIGKITSALGRYNINICSAHAESYKKPSAEMGHVHIFVDKAQEKNIYKAIDHISKLDIMLDKIKYYRII
jgi:homoserine dehydrogenase